MSRKDELSKRNLFQELLDLRDSQRRAATEATFVVDGEDLPWEVNQLGVVKWYLHPLVEDTAVHSLNIYTQKIAPGSRSGRLRVQGGQVIHVIEGSGYSVIDSKKVPWTAGDVLQIPLRWDGTIFQHFNTNTESDALLICAEPNFVFALGVDRGSGFEVLENSPEFMAQ